jgi:hypothetical protein
VRGSSWRSRPRPVLSPGCRQCRDRGPIALSYIGTDNMPPEGDPTPCPCGWEPREVILEFVDRPLPRHQELSQLLAERSLALVRCHSAPEPLAPPSRRDTVLVEWVAPTTSTSVSARPISPGTERCCLAWLSWTT